ncbi:hypothetical protein Asp14428_21950 [Actinoplanes sp. NBRC 14428]|nr:hypothetical protein Asp14428_21950 [Actinoplanes sp. NBRC 14428]
MTDPVFVDRTGRRRRFVALAGSAGALVLVLAVLALVAGFTGAGPGPVPGWAEYRVERVRPAKAPSVPVRPRTRPAPPTSPPAATAAPTRSRAAGIGNAPSPSASPSTGAAVNSHRRVPTHTPTARPGKKH